MIIAMGKQKKKIERHRRINILDFTCVLVKVIVGWNHSNRSIIYINI